MTDTPPGGKNKVNRTMVEVDPATRKRLRRVAVEKEMTMKQLMEQVARDLELQTFGSLRPVPAADDAEEPHAVN